MDKVEPPSARGAKCGKALRNRKFSLPGYEKLRQNRLQLQTMAAPLKKWLIKNRRNPYPSKAEKIQLAMEGHMTLIQVSNWFANARRRLKNAVGEEHSSWEHRVRMYDSCASENAEKLGVESSDEDIQYEDVGNDNLHSSEKDCENNNNSTFTSSSCYEDHCYSSQQSTVRDNTSHLMLNRFLKDALLKRELDLLDETPHRQRHTEEIDAAVALIGLSFPMDDAINSDIPTS